MKVKGIAICSLGHVGVVCGRRRFKWSNGDTARLPDGSTVWTWTGWHLWPLRLLGRPWTSRKPRWLVGGP